MNTYLSWTLTTQETYIAAVKAVTEADGAFVFQDTEPRDAGLCGVATSQDLLDVSLVVTPVMFSKGNFAEARGEQATANVSTLQA